MCTIVHILGECGAIKAAKINPAISEDLLREILLWKEEGGCSMDDIVVRLRQRTVPSGFEIHTWFKGNVTLYWWVFISIRYQCDATFILCREV